MSFFFIGLMQFQLQIIINIFQFLKSENERIYKKTISDYDLNLSNLRHEISTKNFEITALKNANVSKIYFFVQ